MAVTRGFVGRRTADSSRVPPGQYVTRDFPVLSAGPTPYTPLDAWDFTIRGAVDKPVSWSWTEFKALPREKFTVDIHCVTKWTKLGMAWSGVSLDTFLDATPTEAGMHWRSPTAATRQTFRWRTCAVGRPGSSTSTTGGRLIRSMAGRRDCWYRTCTSGRARSGSVVWSCAPPINPASGRCSAITTMETRGKSSGTTEIDVADRHRDLDDLRDSAGEDDHARRT